MHIGILVPTPIEAKKILRALRFKKVGLRQYLVLRQKCKINLTVTGVGAENVRVACERMLRQETGINVMVLAGFAGGLSENLRVGDIVLEKTLSLKQRNILQKVRSRYDYELHYGKVECVNNIVASPKDKESLNQAAGAIAVEMESSAFYEVCGRYGVEGVMIRAISDSAAQSLPHSVQFTDAFGRPTKKFWLEFIKRPGDWKKIGRLALASQTAGTRLARFLKCYVEEFFTTI